MTFPKPRTERMAFILDRAVNQRFEHSWCPLRFDTELGPLVVQVSCDALAMDGERVNVDAATLFELGEILGAMPLTPKLVDEIAIRADHRLAPQPEFPVRDSPEAQADHSARVDAELERAGARRGDLVANVGKDWVLVSRVLSRQARQEGRAANYGWLVGADELQGGKWRGIPTEPTVSRASLRALQGVGTRHNVHHSDYSQTARFAHRRAELAGRPIDLFAFADEHPAAKAIAHDAPWNSGIDAGGLPEPATDVKGFPATSLRKVGGELAAGGALFGAAAGFAMARSGGAIGGAIMGALLGLAVSRAELKPPKPEQKA